jgi:predicted nucleotidyltransferase
MNKEQIIQTLKKEKIRMQKEFGVEEIALFGSYARGDENENSDIDILVKLKEPKYSYWADLFDFLKVTFGKNVDLITSGNHLSEKFSSKIKNELIYA